MLVVSRGDDELVTLRGPPGLAFPAGRGRPLPRLSPGQRRGRDRPPRGAAREGGRVPGLSRAAPSGGSTTTRASPSISTAATRRSPTRTTAASCSSWPSGWLPEVVRNLLPAGSQHRGRQPIRRQTCRADPDYDAVVIALGRPRRTAALEPSPACAARACASWCIPQCGVRLARPASGVRASTCARPARAS